MSEHATLHCDFCHRDLSPPITLIRTMELFPLAMPIDSVATFFDFLNHRKSPFDVLSDSGAGLRREEVIREVCHTKIPTWVCCNCFLLLKVLIYAWLVQ